MTVSRRLRRRAAWAVPAAVIAAVAAAPTLLPLSVSATDAPNLPAKTAAQLLAAVESSDTQALSGEIVATARLGLPELPRTGSSGTFDWQSLVTGSHTVRVWLDGPQRQRLALLGQLAESDVVRNGRDVWTYESGTQQVTHALLPDRAAKAQPTTPPATSLTPQQAADQALAAIDPTTAVTVDPTQRVAGRDAYTLVLSPKDSTTLVRKVSIAVDSTTSVPLRVQVYGTDPAKAAFETGFTRVEFARPAASVFSFTPPKGATVTERQLPASTGKPEGGQPAEAAARPTVVGSGWSAVAVLPAPAAGSPAPAGQSARLLEQLTTPLPDGSRVLRSSLLSVLFAKDGRVLVGAVSPEVLQQAAG